MVFVTSAWSRTYCKNFEKSDFMKIFFFGIWSKASHTVSIYEKSLIIDLSSNFLYAWNCRKSYD